MNPDPKGMFRQKGSFTMDYRGLQKTRRAGRGRRSSSQKLWQRMERMERMETKSLRIRVYGQCCTRSLPEWGRADDRGLVLSHSCYPIRFVLLAALLSARDLKCQPIQS
jgi:hypothetical protein